MRLEGLQLCIVISYIKFLRYTIIVVGSIGLVFFINPSYFDSLSDPVHIQKTLRTKVNL